VIKDHLNSIVTGARAKEPEAVPSDMTADVQKLLPRTVGSSR
jgi:multiple sugar transport system substrate-binding protein